MGRSHCKWIMFFFSLLNYFNKLILYNIYIIQRLRGKKRKRMLREAKMKEEENRKMRKQRIKASDMMATDDSLSSRYLKEIKQYREQSFTDTDHVRPLVK